MTRLISRGRADITISFFLGDIGQVSQKRKGGYNEKATEARV